MITRSQMRRQLRAQGGIMSVAPRKKFGIGSVFQDFKDKVVDRTRKIIPNELANVAVKAAPFVAMIPGYGPAAAGIMRGLGRLDQRGNLTDAVKQGLLFYGGGKAFGAGMEKAGLRDPGASGIREFFNKDTVQRGRGLFQGNKIEGPPGGGDPNMTYKKPPGTTETKGLEVVKKGVDFVKEKVPFLDKIPDEVAQKLLVGGITSGASALYSYFTGEFDEPQQPGETMEEYMARRNTRVKQQMRGYMDSYYTPLRNPQYAAMSDEEKNNYIDSIVGQGMATGGRVGYQTGGISMLNTAAQNRAINNARRFAANTELQAPRERIQQQMRGMGKSGFQTQPGTLNQGTQRIQNIVMNQAPNRFADYLSGRTEPVTNLSEIASTQSTRDALNQGILGSLERNQVANPMGAQNFLVKNTDYDGYKLGEAQKNIDANSLTNFLLKAAPSMGGEIGQFADTMLGNPQNQIANTLGDYTFQYKPPSYDFDDDYMGIKDKIDFPTTGVLPGSAYDVNVELTDADTKQKIREQLFKDAAAEPSDMPQGSPSQLSRSEQAQISRREQAQKYLNENKLDPAAGYQDYLDPERSYQRQLQSLIDGTNNQGMDAYGESLKQARAKISQEFDDYLNQQGYQKYLSDRETYQSAPAIMERENKLKQELNRLAGLDENVREGFGFSNILNDPNYRKQITGYTGPDMMTPTYRNLSSEELQNKLKGSLDQVYNQYGITSDRNYGYDENLTPGELSTLRNQLGDLEKYGNVDQEYLNRIDRFLPGTFNNLEDIQRRLDPNRTRFDMYDPSKQLDYGNLKFKDNYSLSMPSRFYKNILDRSQGLPSQYQGYAKNLLKELQGLASGGRVGLMGGSMPMGEPRVNQGGITELDFRAKGGFVPVGIKEKADDVPAMLSKNEFVFTADAVRGAGNGSVEKGAQKMYDTMKNLERRVT